MKTVKVYSLFGYPTSEMTKKEKVAFWLLLTLATLSFASIATAYVLSVVGNASGENIPFV